MTLYVPPTDETGSRIMSNAIDMFVQGLTCMVCKTNRACWVLHHATNDTTLRVCNETPCRYAYASYTFHSHDNTSCDKCIYHIIPRHGDKLKDMYLKISMPQ